MTVYQKIGGSWVAIDQAYRRVGGVWKSLTFMYANDGGVWKPAFAADTTPPDPPEIILDNIGNKYISVGVRLTDPDHDTTLRKIRVLANFKQDNYPSTPYSSGFYGDSDTIGGPEPWSEFYYNDAYTSKQGALVTPTRKSNEISFKKFAPTYYAGKQLAPSTTYRFRAWAQDEHGNWSLSASASITTPKKFGEDLPTIRSAVVLPVRVGTLDVSSGIFTEGDAKIQSADRVACFDYGSNIINLIGGKAKNVSATMRLHRAPNGLTAGLDPYAASHRTYGSISTSGVTQYLEKNYLFNKGGSANLNACAKGQVVSKNIPEDWLNNYASSLRAVNLLMHPSHTATTKAVFLSQADDPNQGAMYVRWTE